MSTDEYLQQIADKAKSTPRSPGGLVVDLRIPLYAGGHSAVSTVGAAGVPLNDDAELVKSLATIIEKMRTRMAA